MSEINKISLVMKSCLAAADFEDGASIAAGVVAFVGSPGQLSANFHEPGEDEAKIAFGRFVRLMRRKHRLTIESLARKADIDLSELLAIEEHIRHAAEPRTVFQLARCFGVPTKSLAKLAGLSKDRDPELEHEAVRFAARSESVARLSKEEAAALDTFVAVLAQQK